MRKTLMLAAATVAAMAAMTATANASFSIHSAFSGNPCPAVSLSGNTASGGCLVENMDGGWTMMHPATGQILTGCQLNFDFRINSTATLYAINQDNSCAGLNRQACTDNTTGEQIPWPGFVTWEGGQLVEKIDMCFENPSTGSDTWERVTWLADWGADSHFVGFDQLGSSQNGYIANADFDHLDAAEYVGLVLVDTP